MITIHNELASAVRLAWLALGDVEVHAAGPELVAATDELCHRVRKRYGGQTPGQIQGAARAREVYRVLGVDPTRYRLSSENLLRRALQGEAFPRINSLVDTINLCSLALLLPFGVYDLRALAGPVTLRLGSDGEGYEGLGGRTWVDLAGKPLLADPDGPFGNPSADSARSSIREDTQEVLITIFAPASYPRANLELDAADVAIAVTRFNEGFLHESGIA